MSTGLPGGIWENVPGEYVARYRPIVWNTVYPFSVTINALDVNNNVVLSKTIDGVRVFKNKTTVLKGKLYSNSGTAQTLHFSVKDQWSADTVHTDF